MPHRAAIQRAIAECLSVEPNRISVKATTSEKLGFIGRREGIEASAIATIRTQ
jgi:2-C-methyl-D-erythritol 4-phosphate cytidylyltransferase/2-C-methyl-D-erythritol 2,4-cyclodiphosphate synthase